MKILITQYTIISTPLQRKCMNFAVRKLYKKKKQNEKHGRPILNIKVSGDGSWKKRGFKSLYGITTLITMHITVEKSLISLYGIVTVMHVEEQVDNITRVSSLARGS